MILLNLCHIHKAGIIGNDVGRLKAIESSRHAKMKMNQFLIERLGIQRVVVVIFNIAG